MKEDARTYILSKLTKIVKDISELRILYKYDPFSKEHLIKVLPINEYKNNQSYNKFEEEFLFDFISKYPYDSLVFLSDDEWIDIDKPDEIFEGANYFEESNLLMKSDIIFTNFQNNELLEFTNIDDDIFNLGEIIDSYNTFDLDLDSIQPPLITVKTLNLLNPSLYQLQDKTDHCIFETDHNDNPISSNYGYINYALAA